MVRELRPHLSFDEYVSIYEEAHRSDGYRLVAIEKSDKVMAVMGYRILSDFVRGRHIYIDDLIVSENSRSSGLGPQLLQYADEVAQKLGCKSLRLCAAMENDRGIKFYDKNGWTKRAYAYVKKTSM